MFTFVGILLGNAVVHAVAWGLPRGALWGVHHYAFYSPGVLVMSTVTLVAAGFAALLHRGSNRVESPQPAAFQSWTGWQKGLALSALAAAALGLFWFLRTRHLFLGDGFAIVDSLPKATHFHPLEPLAVQIQQWTYQWLSPLIGGGREPYLVAWDTAAWVSVMAGAVFAPILLALARELRILGNPAAGRVAGLTLTDVLLFLVLLAQGYVQLFFGYVEIYAIYSVGVALYLWMAVRYLNRSAPLWPAAAALALCLALHLSAAVLLPSLGVLALAGLTDPVRRRAALRDLVLGAGAFAIVGAGLAWMGEGYNLPVTLWKTALLALASNQETIPSYLFSSMHVRDFVNAQLLIGPLALALFVPATLWTLTRRRMLSMPATFLIVAGGTYLGVCIIAGDSNLGYARNWDLIAPAGLVFTAAGLGLFLMQVKRVRFVQPAMAVALAVSLFHTVPWIGVNASPDRAFDRFFTLPLGLGRVESTVGYWFAIQERFDLAEQWLIRSVDENSDNVRAHALLGDIYRHREQYDRACVAYGEATRIRPDIRVFRMRLIDSSVRAQKPDLAVFELRNMVVQEPGNADLWAALGVALAGSREWQAARAALERAAELDTAGHGYLEGVSLLQTDEAYHRLLLEYWPRIFDS
jgi:tetratricopeptide (TPR) repeat protein